MGGGGVGMKIEDRGLVVVGEGWWRRGEGRHYCVLYGVRFW